MRTAVEQPVRVAVARQLEPFSRSGPDVGLRPADREAVMLVTAVYARLRYYATSSSSPVPTFRDNVSVPSSRVKKSKKPYRLVGTRTLSRNVGRGLPLVAA
jgi:hypothetical protein